MNIVIGNHEFIEHPFQYTSMPKRAGVYALLKPIGADYELLDFGFERSLETAPRICDAIDNGVSVVVLYVDNDEEANKILKELESEYGPDYE